jgi:hypothetical protein
MSANPVARPQSRRTFLKAGSAAVIGGASAGAIAAPSAQPSEADEVNRLWRQWLILRATDGESDEESNRICDAMNAAEYAIEAQPPSAARAAAVLAINLFWNSQGRAPAQLARAESDGWPMLHALNGLRPHLTGDLARAVDGFNAEPDTDLSATLTALAEQARAVA